MSAGQKMGPAIMCLVFGIPFGGIGAFTSWMMIETARDWYAARDWVRVKADLLTYDGNGGNLKYRYVMDGRQFEGTRLSVAALADKKNLSDDADARLQATMSQKKPLMVFANPSDPSQSVFDREMPWMMMVFMTPFALGFGGVGLGAFWVLTKVLTGSLEETKPVKGPRMSEARSGLVGTWIFVFFWNVISFPIAMVTVPELWAQGEYLGLFVLIFPAVGLLVMWAAIAATIGYIRRGGASLNLNPENPRAGSAMQGFIAFPRGVDAGQSFKTRLVCNRVTGDGSNRASKIPKWSKEQTLRTTQTPQGVRLPFRFEVPADVPGSRKKDGDTAKYQWRVEATLAEAKRALPYAFDFDLQPAPADAFATEPAAASEEEPPPVALGPQFAKLESLAEERGIQLTNDEREEIGTLTDTQRELAVKALQFGPKIKKIRKYVIWVAVAVVAFQVVSAILMLVGTVNR